MLPLSVIKENLYQLVGTKASSSRDDIAEGIRVAILSAQQRFALAGDWEFLEQYQNFVYIPLIAPYETGTVTVTQDSKTVTGASTVWTSDMVGDFFQLDSGELYEIRSFTSATSIELAIPYQSATAATQDYRILKRYYNLPLDFLRPVAQSALLVQLGSGTSGEGIIDYNANASFSDPIETGTPQWYGIPGNNRTYDYYNTSTVTIATSGTTSTWTVAAGTLPLDAVDREVRIVGEDRPYRIKTRSSGSAFITYETYVNPDTLLGTQLTASSWAMTPKETKLISFSAVPSQRFIFKMPYIRKLPELLLDSDISPISLAGYDRALLACCRAEVVKNGRLAVRGDLIQSALVDATDALAEAWGQEVYSQTLKEQASGSRFTRKQTTPAWL